MMWENLPPKKLYCQDLSNFSQSYLYWRSTFYTIYSLIEISPLNSPDDDRRRGTGFNQTALFKAGLYLLIHSMHRHINYEPHLCVVLLFCRTMSII